MPSTKTEYPLIGTVISSQRNTFNLSPIRAKIHELEANRNITSFCKEIGLSRGQLYLILNGKSNASEESLNKILGGLKMTKKEIGL